MNTIESAKTAVSVMNLTKTGLRVRLPSFLISLIMAIMSENTSTRIIPIRLIRVLVLIKKKTNTLEDIP